MTNSIEEEHEEEGQHAIYRFKALSFRFQELGSFLSSGFFKLVFNLVCFAFVLFWLPAHQFEIIFVGTGTSEGIPRVSCLTNPSKKCPVCTKSAEPGFSITVHFVGFLPMGLDDLRDWTNNVQPHIPIYVAKRDFETLTEILDTSEVIPGAAVSDLQFNVINEEPFVVHDLKITPLPVWHGPGYRFLGFCFGSVCYISDVSEIPEETYRLLEDCEILILDALRPDRSSTTHFRLPRALEEVQKIKPKRTLFTGMMHLMDHEKVNEGFTKLIYN
ncbi:hypothetical protein QYF36_004627 [Acer negundo]|nr:hypothetical protein QYF36_004627 [Acer negundo]